MVLPTLRGAALFLAAFTAIGLVGELRGRTMDTSLWWVDLRDVTAAVRLPLMASLAALLGAWALRPTPGPRRRLVTAAACALFAGLALRDVAGFYAAVRAGDVQPFVPVPLSLLIALLVMTLAGAVLRRTGARAPDGNRQGGVWLGVLAPIIAAAAWAILFPLAQMLFFGTTDYRRPADAAVVFGARVYASGQPSPLLADRIRTGVELWRAGLVPELVMSGGDGSDGFNEARVMRDAAVAAGVDPAAIIVDPSGSSTEATVADVSALLATRDGIAAPERRLIAVSQAYHLPRVQLAFGAAGIDVLTVPAADPQPIGEMPLLVAREVLAFWAYDLRVCLG
jgi:vancomycin permeability regulator SanA